MLPGNLGKGPYARRRNPESLRLEEEKGKDSLGHLGKKLAGLSRAPAPLERV